MPFSHFNNVGQFEPKPQPTPQPTEPQYDFFGATYHDMYMACIGGLLISLASTLHLLLKGRVTGMSGILNGIITYDSGSFHWKLSALLGMIITSSATLIWFNENNRFFDDLNTFRSGLSYWGFGIAGLLVGMGTKIGNGCTSGHGVCGLPRFSIRSIVGVFSFMTSALLTANFMSYLRENNYAPFLTGTSDVEQIYDSEGQHSTEMQVVFYGSIAIFVLYLIYQQFNYQKANKIQDCIISLLVGAIFALGLILSGMVNRRVVLGFLTFNKMWNPSLAFVLLCAVIPNILTFYLIQQQEKPLLENNFSIPYGKDINKQLIFGTFVFGLGWGLAGICPGPSFCLIPTVFVELIFIFFIAQCFGSFGVTQFQEYQKRQAELALE